MLPLESEDAHWGRGNDGYCISWGTARLWTQHGCRRRGSGSLIGAESGFVVELSVDETHVLLCPVTR